MRHGRDDHSHSHDHSHPHDHRHDHAHGHARGHAHGRGGGDARGASGASRALTLALAFTGTFMVVEFVAGHLTGSLALLADAGHMLSDVGSLSLALFATWIGRRPRSPQKTFGYRRTEVIAALVNGATLGLIAVLIALEAVERFAEPRPVVGEGVVVVGSLGLLVNLASAWILHRRGSDSVNVRAALAHVLGDALGSVAAITAGVIVLTTGYVQADPALSLLVAALLLWGAWRIVGETTHILMEGTPPGVDVSEIEQAIAAVPGVAAVHDLHVWSITSGEAVVTAHVVLRTGHHGTEVAHAVGEVLERRFHLQHVTIQPERARPGLVQVGLRPRPSPGEPGPPGEAD